MIFISAYNSNRFLDLHNYTNPKIIVVSTPWKPIGFFYQIDNNPNSIFYKLYLDYIVGLNKIYNVEDIEKERSQPYFGREFMLQYSIGTGNVFTEQSIINASELGKKYYQNRLKVNFAGTTKSMGIDPGFANSKTAFTILEQVDQLVRVIYSKQFEHSSTEDMVNHAYNLIRQYNLNKGNNLVFIDGSKAGFIRSLKIKLNEYPNYEYFVEKTRKDGN